MNGYTRPRLLGNLERVTSRRRQAHHRLLKDQPGGIWLRILGKSMPVLLPLRTAASEHRATLKNPWRGASEGGP